MHAAELARLFGCTTVVDEWDGTSEVPDRALVLALPEQIGLAASEAQV